MDLFPEFGQLGIQGCKLGIRFSDLFPDRCELLLGFGGLFFKFVFLFFFLLLSYFKLLQLQRNAVALIFSIYALLFECWNLCIKCCELSVGLGFLPEQGRNVVFQLTEFGLSFFLLINLLPQFIQMLFSVRDKFFKFFQSGLACGDGGINFGLLDKFFLQRLVFPADFRKRIFHTQCILVLFFKFLEVGASFCHFGFQFFPLDLHDCQCLDGVPESLQFILLDKNGLTQFFLLLSLPPDLAQFIFLPRDILFQLFFVGFQHCDGTGKIRRVLVLLRHCTDAAPEIEHHGKDEKNENSQSQDGDKRAVYQRWNRKTSIHVRDSLFLLLGS